MSIDLPLAAAIAAVCLALVVMFAVAFGTALARAFAGEQRIDPDAYACACGDPLVDGYDRHLCTVTWSPGIDHRPVLAHPVDRMIKRSSR